MQGRKGAEAKQGRDDGILWNFRLNTFLKSIIFSNFAPDNSEKR